MYKVITPVSAEPVTVVEAKLHLRVDVNDEDTLIGALITAAREWAEHYTGRAFASQTLEMTIKEFPEDLGDEDCDYIDLDLPPAASVASIKYTSVDGTEITIDGTAYALSTYGESRRVAPTYGNTWPSVQDVPDAVRIRYVTGYTTLPKAAKAALLLLIGHLYENRQAVSALSLDEIPLGARSLLDTIKIWSR